MSDRPPLAPVVTVILNLLFFILEMVGFLVATVRADIHFQIFWGVLLLIDAIRDLGRQDS